MLHTINVSVTGMTHEVGADPAIFSLLFLVSAVAFWPALWSLLRSIAADRSVAGPASATLLSLGLPYLYLVLAGSKAPDFAYAALFLFALAMIAVVHAPLRRCGLRWVPDAGILGVTFEVALVRSDRSSERSRRAIMIMRGRRPSRGR